MTNGAINRIANERGRQIEEEGWSEEHDDGHTHGELASAACAYLKAYAASRTNNELVSSDRMQDAYLAWPWEDASWRPDPSNPERMLEKAGALIAAELDRLNRAKEQTNDR